MTRPPPIDPPESQVSRHLPPDAVTLLRAAARTHNPRVIDKAIASVRNQYPNFFKDEQNETPDH